MKAAYEAATDPAVKSALEDGKITRAEYDAAVQWYVACAADQGVTITPHEQDGLYNYEVVREPNTDAVIDSCTPVIQTIESLYSSMLKYPENRNMEDVIADCLKRAGLVPRDGHGEKFASATNPTITAATPNDRQHDIRHPLGTRLSPANPAPSPLLATRAIHRPQGWPAGC